MSNDTNREAVFLYVTHNFERLKAMVLPYKVQRDEMLKTENAVFREEINRQFANLVRSIILNDAALNLNLNPEEIISFVEDISVEEFTK